MHIFQSFHVMSFAIVFLVHTKKKCYLKEMQPVENDNDVST